MRLIILLFVFATAFALPLNAQNISIVYNTPDALSVCNTDTLQITVQNNTGNTLSGAVLDLELPAGIEYVPGSLTAGTENDLSNLGSAELGLPALAPGAPLTLRVGLRASCAVIDAINSSTLFTATLRVRQGLISEQTTTTAFPVETGLLVITQIDNDSISGEKNQVLTRTIHVKNTRLGLIRNLTFYDTHDAGISINTPGAALEVDQPTSFSAQFDGAFFSNFGDGDTLLEFGETLLIEEQITIEECGIPNAFFVHSNISAGWGCSFNQPECQADSSGAKVYVLPFSFLPDLKISSEYRFPENRCALEPAQQVVRLANTGPAPAQNIFVQLKSEYPELLGLDAASFELVIDGVAQPIQPTLSTPQMLDSCQVEYHAAVTLIIPEIKSAETVELRFNTFLCSQECSQKFPAIFGNYFYQKECPVGGSVADTFLMAGFGQLVLDNDMEIGECLAENGVYELRYKVQSGRLLDDSGYLHLVLDLPWGLFLDPACNTPNSETPEQLSIDTLVTFDTITRVSLRYALPLNSDSLIFNFCVKNLCPSDGSYTLLDDETIPGPDGNFYIYDAQCSSCSYLIRANALIAATPDYDLVCDVSACDEVELRALCDCGLSSGDPNTGIPTGMYGACTQCVAGTYELDSRFTAYRLNLGLPDHDDDRSADPGAIDTALVRRDRFWPGDTMRVNISSVVLSGDSICNITYGLYVETVRSAIGHAGNNDIFDIAEARDYFADPDKFRRLRAVFSIWRDGQAVAFDCPFDPVSWSEKGNLYGIVTNVNIDPPEPIDELVSMNQIVNFDVNSLIQAGCLPDCFALSGGDSITLEVDFKLDFNFTPASPNSYPPLINFELGFQDKSASFYNYRRGDTLMFQYTGYLDTMTTSTSGIRACTTSTQVSPFLYGVRIARPNLFPHEVRPIVSISDYDLILPAGVSPASATLKYLDLQEGFPVFSDAAIPFSVQDSALDLDFDAFFLDPLDEGFRLEARLDFEANCRFIRPDSSAQWVVLDYADCIHMPDPDTILKENFIGFFSNIARDTITTGSLIVDIASDTAEAVIQVKNLAPVAASNYYLYAVSPDGGLVDFELFQLPQNTPATQVNGIFQLGNLGILGQKNLLVRARNISCNPQRLWLVYGWDCQPVLQPGTAACAADTLEILFRPQKPELELDLLQMPLQAPLCDTSEYMLFEMFNADLGNAFEPFVGVELPQGISILPGSSQIAYPSGSAFVGAPDPVSNGSGVFEWDIAALVPAIGTAGLPGVIDTPANGIQIRFRVLTECGVVSNTQFVFSARALQPCGESANTLRKASNPLIIEGLAPSYGTQIGIAETGGPGGPVFCEETRTLSISVQVSGSATSGDSIYISLPPGYSFVEGSYAGGVNAPAGPPQVSGQELALPLPTGLPANSIFQFNMDVLTAALPTCEAAVVLVQTREQSSAFCPLLNEDCDVYISTGVATYNFIPVNPDVKILGASAGTTPAGNGQYNITFLNAGATTVSPSLVQIYRDADADGALSAGDILLYEAPFNASIDPNDVFTLLDDQAPNPVDLCNLLAVLPAAENCDCEPVVYPFSGGAIQYAAQNLCAGDSALVGIDAAAGHFYQWLSAPVAGCDTCTQLQWLPDPGQYEFVLFDQIPGCNVSHVFEVVVHENPVPDLPDLSVCRNETVVLQTSPAAAWNWAGPGITDPAAATQSIPVVQSGAYSVTITNTEGCTGEAAGTITMLPTDSTELGVAITCQGTPVEVPGGSTDTPGVYCFVYQNQSGCDSTVCLTLQVIQNTFEEMLRCPGDTLYIFGEPVVAAGDYCRAFPSSQGCDSTHCVTVSDLPEVGIPGLDTVLYMPAPGDTVQLVAPAGYISYEWSPAEGLSCTFCPDPIVVAQDSITYTLTVTNEDGCRGEVYYRLFPFPPCDPFRLVIPNAISPNGDGNNDVFRAVPYEGVEIVSRLTIFNRWGEKIFEKSGVNAVWDGTQNGQPAPSDVYIWLLEVECSGERKVRHGDVTVVR